MPTGYDTAQTEIAKINVLLEDANISPDLREELEARKTMLSKVKP